MAEEGLRQTPMAQAALRMAELIMIRPESTEHDKTYQRLMYGHRRKFGVA
jgi:hypothetical protein